MRNILNRYSAGIAVITIWTLFLVILLSFKTVNGQENKTSTKDTLPDSKAITAKFLNVASVQMRSSGDLQDNVTRIKSFIRTCSDKGVRVAVFPECALSGYFDKVIATLSAEQISQAENKVAAACRESGIYAIIGMPYRDGKKLYNSAAVISPEGKIIERYNKVQLAESWPDPGDHLSVFQIDDVPCSIIICHDERYPELVRLPVLAGARVIFYISHESDLMKEDKIIPYRAQIQARAVENNVYVVQANAPANKDLTGSHGQSRIIAPDGNIMQEASIFGEDLLTGRLDLKLATGENSKKSMTRGPLQDWWKDGIKQVRIIR